MATKYRVCNFLLKRNNISVIKRILHKNFSNDVLINTEKPLTWSYFHGASDRPLLGATIGQVLESAAQKYTNEDAFVFLHQQSKLSFEELLTQSDQLAAGLCHLGAKKGDRVGIWAPNCLEWILAQYATARAGLILVNINPGYKASELKYCLQKVGLKILIMSDKYKNQNYYEVLKEIIPELDKMGERISSKELPVLEHAIVVGQSNFKGTLNFSDVMSMGGNKELKAIKDIQKKLQFDDPINIQFTSGTSGLPKGATLTHHSILNNARNVGFNLNYDKEKTVICLPLPLYHCFGMVLGSLEVILHGATCVVSSATFDAVAAMDAVQKYKCTSLYGTPTMFIDYINALDRKNFDVSSLKTGLISGAPCPIELLRKVIKQLHMKDLSICYGLTENSPIIFQTLAEDSPEVRITSVGKVHEHVEVKIVDENGNLVPIKESGEIYVRGYSVMESYWGDENATQAAKASGGWLKTGDIGVIDENGYCSIIGRKKDLIIRGGENIYPAEIEQFLHQHDNVKDAQVIGVPDYRLGEEIAVWISLRKKKKVPTATLR